MKTPAVTNKNTPGGRIRGGRPLRLVTVAYRTQRVRIRGIEAIKEFFKRNLTRGSK